MGCLPSRLLSVRTVLASMVATTFAAARIVSGVPRRQAVQAFVRPKWESWHVLLWRLGPRA